jgi:alcohol dehydrogenase class IV
MDMHLPSNKFVDNYRETRLIYGRGEIARLNSHLEHEGASSVLIVCGSESGANGDLMEPVREAIGDRLVGVFDETTPAKRLAMASRGAKRVSNEDVDHIVAVGGGSSLDVGRAMSVLVHDDRDETEFEQIAEEGEEPEPLRPGSQPVPMTAVPTTFAGADLSYDGSLMISGRDEPPTGTVSRVRIGDRRAVPGQIYYDPELFETTPKSALIGSAMNGFDKGLETVYAHGASPVTDSTAVRGLKYFKQGLTGLYDETGAMDRAVIGALLVQIKRRTNVIHAFGHGFSRRYPVHQGVIHAVLAPVVLSDIFNRVDGHREVLAEGLEIDTGGLNEQQVADAVVSAVQTIRDELGLPTQLRRVDSLNEVDFEAVARFIHTDGPMDRAPAGYDPLVKEIKKLLKDAW